MDNHTGMSSPTTTDYHPLKKLDWVVVGVSPGCVIFVAVLIEDERVCRCQVNAIC